MPDVRANFWRRGFAWIIDGIIIGMVLGVLGLLLFEPTGGRIRVSEMLISTMECSVPKVEDLIEFPLPSDFRVTNAGRCNSSLLGHVHDRKMILVEVSRSGWATYRRSLKFNIDRDGRPMRAFDLDYLYFLVFGAYLLFFEWQFGATLGKDFLGLRVRSVSGTSLVLLQALKRLTVRYIPLTPFMVVLCLALTIPSTNFFEWFPYLAGLLAIGAILVIAYAWHFIVTVRRGNLPWHDQWAHTEVVRMTRSQSLNANRDEHAPQT